MPPIRVRHVSRDVIGSRFQGRSLGESQLPCPVFCGEHSWVKMLTVSAITYRVLSQSWSHHCVAVQLWASVKCIQVFMPQKFTKRSMLSLRLETSLRLEVLSGSRSSCWAWKTETLMSSLASKVQHGVEGKLQELQMSCKCLVQSG